MHQDGIRTQSLRSLSLGARAASLHKTLYVVWNRREAPVPHHKINCAASSREHPAGEGEDSESDTL